MNDSTTNRYRYLGFVAARKYRRYIQDDNNQGSSKNIVPPTETDIPAHGTYAAALFRPEWKLKREEILKRDAYSCVICKQPDNLQVHHRQYHFAVKENKFRLPWEYPDELMITLCGSCHNRGHNKYKVPIINV
ncbi:MAG: hypothetical protein DI539_24585 [Flavobacterium psychrophilum]|nr:MAG: hypothetical protein DI539_24585 [Flavobacterium psychrophilum]